ncbi:MAG: hypothetical protein ACE5F5_03005 [Acidimicrobiia bacterium]
MAEAPTPVSIGKPSTGDGLASVLGQAAADILRLHMAVIDREDRLESGTGGWKAGVLADAEARAEAAEAAVLRALRMAADATNFSILKALTDGVGTPVDHLCDVTGLGRLELAERLGDLTSAGLATKIPEANQVAGVPAGAALVELVSSAAATAARDLGREG